MHEPRQYHERNRNIVDATDILVATPKENKGDIYRGGTWYTINYAVSKGKPVYIIWPDGRQILKRKYERVEP